MSASGSTPLKTWLERIAAARERLEDFEDRPPGELGVRGRPRSREEWEYLRARGTPEARLGPRWEGPGEPPRYPANPSK